MSNPVDGMLFPGAVGDFPTADEAPLARRKVFARPFRLVFKRVESQEVQEVVWFSVESLEGLKNVTQRVAEGELVPINSWSTLDRQIWGLLAEHTGFLRWEGPHGELNEGLQPIGAEQAQLADDMAALFGGFEPAIAAISDMRARALAELDATEPSVDSGLLKDDGINLTPEGENVLAEMIYGEQSDASLQVQKEAANAEILTDETQVESATDYAIKEIEADNRELTSRSGPDAELEADRVQRAAEGDLDEGS